MDTKRKKRKGFLKSTFFYGLLIASSVFLALIFGELGLRLFSKQLPVELRSQIMTDCPRCGVYHPYIGHLHTPNDSLVISGRTFSAVHNTDTYGFRNVWPWPEKAEIIVLGDSLVFGYGVEDEQAWPAILDRSRPDARVINLGLVGTGPEQYLRVFETFGIQMQPRLLLVGIYPGNDFWDTGLFNQWDKAGIKSNYMIWRNFDRRVQGGFNWRNPISSMKSILRRTSKLYNLLLAARNAYRSKRSSEPMILELADGTRLEIAPRRFASLTGGARPERQEFKLALDALKRLVAMAEENGTHVLMVLQPSKEEIYMSSFGLPAPDPGKSLRAAFDKLDFKYLDLTQAFRNHAEDGEQLFFEADSHPNARGYALIAQEVLAYLEKKANSYGLHSHGQKQH